MWGEYVPVAARRAKAAKSMEARRKKGLPVEPVTVQGLKIAKTFWGKAWCDAMESQADFANRLPRGRTYARNGSVVHLGVGPGEVQAFVSGSELYTVNVRVKPLSAANWKSIRDACAAQPLSALEILQGKLADNVLRLLTRPGDGLIPRSGDFSMSCSCPDSARLCKHVAAVLYGVGARLDHRPELLFTLRGVKHEDLVTEAVRGVTRKKKSAEALAVDDAALGDLFGIDLGGESAAPPIALATNIARAAREITAPKAKPAAPKAKPAAAPAEDLTAGALREMGYGPSKLKRMLSDGVIERVGFGWYRFLRAP